MKRRSDKQERILKFLQEFLAEHAYPTSIRDIQAGEDASDPKDDVLVLAYISVGEDLRTIGITDAEKPACRQ